MAEPVNTGPLPDTLATALRQAWARLGQRQFEPLAKWRLMHVDRDGEFQSIVVDVLEAIPLERMILVRGSPDSEPLVIKLSRIVEAVDLPTGRKVVLDHWLAHVGSGHRPEENRTGRWIH